MQLREKYIAEALEQIVVRMANYARDNHPYVDRTGHLTDSIFHSEPKKSGNTYDMEFGAGMEYAEYVENPTRHSPPFPFIKPAIEQHRNQLRKAIDNAEKKALREAGLN